MRYITFAILILGLTACAATKLSPKKLSSGTWLLERAYEKKVNVTNRENPNRDRVITFNEDGSFSSTGAPYGNISGRWEITEEGALSLIPDGNGAEPGPSVWRVEMDKLSMKWRSAGGETPEGLELYWSRQK